jgi:kynurenine formamidase
VPPKLSVEQVDSINAGGPLNSFRVSFANHVGTHVDAPYHFSPTGRRIVDFGIDEYLFREPQVVDVPKGDSEYITTKDLLPGAPDLATCDLLLLRTGFSQYRSADPLRYAKSNPGLSGDAARFLLDRCPRLRAIGIDAVSIEFEAHYEHCFAAHRELLCNDARPFLIIEDLALDLALDGLVGVLVVPLFVAGIDASPCTVVGELRGDQE